MSCWNLYLLFTIVFCSWISEIALTDIEQTIAMVNSTITLSCNLTTDTFVKWYVMPVEYCEVHDNLLSDHLIKEYDRNVGDELVNFSITGLVATLQLVNVQINQEGCYVCFDYKQNNIVNITVAVPPTVIDVQLVLPPYASRTFTGRFSLYGTKPPCIDVSCTFNNQTNVIANVNNVICDKVTKRCEQHYVIQADISSDDVDVLCEAHCSRHVVAANGTTRVGRQPAGTPTLVSYNDSQILECSDEGVTRGTPADLSYQWKVNNKVIPTERKRLLYTDDHMTNTSSHRGGSYVYQCTVYNMIGASGLSNPVVFNPEVRSSKGGVVSEAGLSSVMITIIACAAVVLVVIIIFAALYCRLRQDTRKHTPSVVSSSYIHAAHPPAPAPASAMYLHPTSPQQNYIRLQRFAKLTHENDIYEEIVDYEDPVEYRKSYVEMADIEKRRSVYDNDDYKTRWSDTYCVSAMAPKTENADMTPLEE